jgi:predicted alpha/beta hydrolase family esterase
MKRAIIIHCWGGKANYAWYPWLKAELEKRGYQVTVPDMPNTGNPQLAEWLPTLQDLIGQPDDELLLVGHSLGSVAIMRYLEALPEGQQIGKTILAAGFTDPLGARQLENFFDTWLDFGKIKPKSKHGFVVIQSDNDPWISAQYGTRLQEELGAKLVIKHGAKHMSGDLGDEGACTELPEVIENLQGEPGD